MAEFENYSENRLFRNGIESVKKRDINNHLCTSHFKAMWKMAKLRKVNFMTPVLLLLLSLFSCVWLCDPIDCSPPGSSVPGILQARTLDWVAISFSNACMHAKLLQSCLTLCDPMDRSPPGSSVYGILQARIPEWVAIPFSIIPLLALGNFVFLTTAFLAGVRWHLTMVLISSSGLWFVVFNVLCNKLII